MSPQASVTHSPTELAALSAFPGSARPLTTLLTDFSQAMDLSS